MKPKNQHMKKFQKLPLKGIYLIAALAICLNACKKGSASVDQASTQESNQSTTILGKPVTLCHGKATSFVTKDANGNPQCIGFTFSEDAIANLPDVMTETPI